MKNKLFTITALITLVLAIFCIFSMFVSVPDVVLFKMFGYAFGVNYTQHIEIKVFAVIFMFLLIMLREITYEQQTDK
jgi:hypothetical protein